MDVSSIGSTSQLITDLFPTTPSSALSGATAATVGLPSESGVVFTPSQELLNMQASETSGLLGEMGAAPVGSDPTLGALPAMVNYQLYNNAGAVNNLLSYTGVTAPSD